MSSCRDQSDLSTATFFDQDPLTAAARQVPFWASGSWITVAYGFWSSKRRTIRSPLIVGFVIWTAGLVGMATVQPNQPANAIVFAVMCGLGFGGPLILLISGTQLSVPHHLIAIATAIMTSSRALAGAMITAISSAAVTSSMNVKLPAYVAKAAVGAGLPESSVSEFVPSLLGKDSAALEKIAASPSVMAAAQKAILQASADSFRLVFIIAAPFGVVAIIMSWFVEDVTKLMTYHVDAPVEVLHAKGTRPVETDA